MRTSSINGSSRSFLRRPWWLDRYSEEELADLAPGVEGAARRAGREPNATATNDFGN
jgi:hypothetical protein